MNGTLHVDATDLAILDLLRADARRTIADVARAVNLSPAPVKRRIDRLERNGVIAGYTALVNDAKLGRGVEAFAELRVAGTADAAALVERVSLLPDVQEIFSMAGDPDALVRLRVEDAAQLRRAIAALRNCEGVTSTRTLMVLDSWRR